MSDMKRRAFITLLGGAACGRSLVAIAGKLIGRSIAGPQGGGAFQGLPPSTRPCAALPHRGQGHAGLVGTQLAPFCMTGKEHCEG
jgi:hypothetical protein